MEAILHHRVARALRNEELPAVQAVAPALLSDEVKLRRHAGVGPARAERIIGVGLPVAVVVSPVIDRHGRAVDGIDIVADRFVLLRNRQLAALLAEPFVIAEEFRRVELGADRLGDELLDLRLAVGTGDDRALMDVVVAGDEIVHAILLQAGEKCVLPLGMFIGESAEERVLMPLGDQRLMRKNESVRCSPLAPVEAAADPRLLVGDGVAGGVVRRIGDHAPRHRPVVDDDETRPLPAVAAIERVAQAVEFAADFERTAEIRADGKMVAIRLPELAVASLGIADFETCCAVAVNVFFLSLVVAPEGEKADARVDERTRRRDTLLFGRILAVVAQVADLDDELHPRVDELPVHLFDDRNRHGARIAPRRIGAGPLRIAHHPELPRLRPKRRRRVKQREQRNSRAGFQDQTTIAHG